MGCAETGLGPISPTADADNAGLGLQEFASTLLPAQHPYRVSFGICFPTPCRKIRKKYNIPQRVKAGGRFAALRCHSEGRRGRTVNPVRACLFSPECSRNGSDIWCSSDC